MFLVGPSGHETPLCLDCNAKLQDILDRQAEQHERMINHLTAEMEAYIGLPGLMPQFPPRRPRPIIQTGHVTMHHIRIDHSIVGLVNSGFIGSVDSAVGSMSAAGETNGAAAFKEFTEQVLALNIDPPKKDSILEILTVLASEATLPPPQRRTIPMRALLAELATVTSGVASLAELYARFAPAFARLFS
jgi:hypothetical protein